MWWIEVESLTVGFLRLKVICIEIQTVASNLQASRMTSGSCYGWLLFCRWLEANVLFIR